MCVLFSAAPLSQQLRDCADAMISSFQIMITILMSVQSLYPSESIVPAKPPLHLTLPLCYSVSVYPASVVLLVRSLLPFPPPYLTPVLTSEADPRASAVLRYHAASAAVCMASLVISAPQSPLALFGWMNLQSVCNLFSSVATQAKSTMTSLTLLLKLREKASDALSGRQAPFFKAPSPGPRGSIDHGHGDGSDDEGDSSNLIGLHTRLIERGNQGMARSRVFKGNARSPSPRQQAGQSSTATEPSRPSRTLSNGSDVGEMKTEATDHVRLSSVLPS